MKKRIILGIILIVGVGIAGFTIGRISNNEKLHEEVAENEILLQYGDSFNAVPTVSINGVDKLNSNSNYQVVFYIDPYCESCIKSFTVAERLNSILKGYVDINILWRQEPSEDIKIKVGVPASNQHLLDNTNLTNPFPTYFILDSKNEILMVTDSTEKLIKKIFSFTDIPKEEIINSSNNYLVNKVNAYRDKEILIYFAMSGCPDCEEADKMIADNNITEEYNMITLYTEQSYGEEEYVDISKLFSTIYDVEWYPSFLIIKPDGYQFIGKELLGNVKEILL